MGSQPTIFLVACVVSLGLTALIREAAPRIGLTDNPDGRRKLHGRATPLGGGVAIFLTTAVILGILWLVPGEFRLFGSLWIVPNEFSADLRGAGLPALLLAGLVIVIVGLVDDRKGLPGKQKLLGQIVACSILLADGLLIERVTILNMEMSFGWFAYPLTIFWLLGAINALNLLDGIDGLATMLGIILCCTIAAMAVVPPIGNPAVAIIAMVFTGSLLGFMRFNFPPASIFLGDSGSMLIGLVVGALAIRGSLEPGGTVFLAAPVAIWTIPIFDSVAAVLRRKLTGGSIYDADRGHLHHRLLNILGSNTKVLGWLAFICVLISVATLIGLIRQDDRIMLITCFGVVAIFVVTGIFGRVELLLVGNRLRRVGRLLVSPMVSKPTEAWETTVHLQGSRQWDLLWTTFVESADKLQLTEIRLDVNVPTVHEAYHASWQRPGKIPPETCWNVEIPLVFDDQPVGRVRVAGRRDGRSACLSVQQLMELIEPFEVRLQALARDEVPAMTHNGVAAADPSGPGERNAVPTAKTPK